MTREEKEQWDIFMKIWVIPALKNTWGEKKCKEIVEALEAWQEQEPDLDKVRAEIKAMYRVILKDTPKDDWAVRWNDCIDEVLETIDKYRLESEEYV